MRLLSYVVLVCLWHLSLSQGDRPSVVTGITPELPEIDGRLDESVWEDAGIIEDFLTTVPVEKGQPSNRTRTYILSNEKAVLIGIECFDDNPEGIVNYSKLRDTELENEDHIRVIIDPFLDGQSGYIFSVNPNGARYDALVSNRGESENKDWDGIWEASTRIHENGWTVEILIPIQSINFRQGLKEWGFNVERNIQRNQEIMRWANVKRDQWFMQTSRAGLLSGLPDFNYGAGLNIRPSIIGNITKDEAGDTNFKVDPALTINKRLGANVTATATFNTDFAETEVDTRQTNLTRFPLFFPEKRAFFLEGADIFEFGFGLSRDIVPFFSRRIGLLEGNQVPITAGGKVNGRIGRTSFGGLVMGTDSKSIELDGVPEKIQSTTTGVFRIKQNVLKESSFGFFGSFGDPLNRSGAWVAGSDFTYQTTRFAGDKNFLAGVWGLYNDRRGLSGDQSAYGLKIDYPNDIWDIAFTYAHIGDAFDPSLGFVPRDAINKFRLGATYAPRPEWTWLRQMRNQLFITYIPDLDWEWQSYRVFTAPVNWRFESGERFEFNVVPTGERIVEPFEISENVIIPEDVYHYFRYRLEGDVAAKRKLNGRVSWWFGPFFDGNLNEYQLTVNWNPATILTFEFSGVHNEAELPFGDFDQTLVGLRARLNVTPDLQLNSFVQYDTDTRNFGVNTRIHWIYHPQGDFFIVYNSNSVYERPEDRFMRLNNQLLIKLRYNFRL